MDDLEQVIVGAQLLHLHILLLLHIERRNEILQVVLESLQMVYLDSLLAQLFQPLLLFILLTHQHLVVFHVRVQGGASSDLQNSFQHVHSLIGLSKLPIQVYDSAFPVLILLLQLIQSFEVLDLQLHFVFVDAHLMYLLVKLLVLLLEVLSVVWHLLKPLQLHRQLRMLVLERHQLLVGVIDAGFE